MRTCDFFPPRKRIYRRAEKKEFNFMVNAELKWGK